MHGKYKIRENQHKDVRCGLIFATVFMQEETKNEARKVI